MITDPIIANVYNGQTLNAFSYVANNPLAFVDPSGFDGEGIVHQPGYPDVAMKCLKKALKGTRFGDYASIHVVEQDEEEDERDG